VLNKNKDSQQAGPLAKMNLLVLVFHHPVSFEKEKVFGSCCMQKIYGNLLIKSNDAQISRRLHRKRGHLEQSGVTGSGSTTDYLQSDNKR